MPVLCAGFEDYKPCWDFPAPAGGCDKSTCIFQVHMASPAAETAVPLPQAAPATAAPVQLEQLRVPPLPPAAASAAAPQLQLPPAAPASAPAATPPAAQQRQQQPADGADEDVHDAGSIWPSLGASLQVETSSHFHTEMYEARNLLALLVLAAHLARHRRLCCACRPVGHRTTHEAGR